MEQESGTATMIVEFPSSVFLLMQLVSDVKDPKFGWQGSDAFQGCHQEISPFLVPHSSIEVHQRLRALEEDAEQATTAAHSNVQATRTKPPRCPTTCCGLLQMLCTHIKLLTMMFVVVLASTWPMSLPSASEPRPKAVESLLAC
jgi:hypothetical protein